MSATVEISETNGPAATPTTTDGIANINLGCADVPNLVPTTYPIVLSSFAPRYSYTKWLRFHLANLGGSNYIGNLKLWKSSGTLLTGELVGCNTNTTNAANTAIATYAHARIAQGGALLSPFPLTADADINITWPNPSWQNNHILTAEPSSAVVCIAGSATTTLVAPGYSNYFLIALAVGVGGTTPPGAVNDKIITFQWDEG